MLHRYVFPSRTTVWSLHVQGWMISATLNPWTYIYIWSWVNRWKRLLYIYIRHACYISTYQDETTGARTNAAGLLKNNYVTFLSARCTRCFALRLVCGMCNIAYMCIWEWVDAWIYRINMPIYVIYIYISNRKWLGCMILSTHNVIKLWNRHIYMYMSFPEYQGYVPIYTYL